MSGNIGFFVRAASEQAFTSAYDYLKIWTLEDNLYPPDSPPPPNGTPIPPPESGVPTITTVPLVNVRSGPGSEYESYGVVSIGATGQVLGQNADGSWFAVAIPTDIAPDGIGWVSGSYVTIDPADAVIPIMP